VRWLTCALILLCGCGSAPETPVAEPARDGAGVLFAYEAGNHLHQYGGRVFEDGRYELFSGEPDWEAFEPFTADQVEQIGAAVDEAMDLPGEIRGGGTPPPDVARATFTLRDKDVVVDQYPRASPPELEAILDLIARLRKKPPVASTWRVWTGEETVTLDVPCDLGDVAVLAGLRDALFMPSPSASAPRLDDPPAGTPLVRIEFADGETHTVAADADEPGRADAVKAALAATDWAKLPRRLC